jgi:hypothetical protein
MANEIDYEQYLPEDERGRAIVGWTEKVIALELPPGTSGVELKVRFRFRDGDTRTFYLGGGLPGTPPLTPPETTEKPS